MKPQDLTLQQLKEIVDGAPEGAEYYEDDTGSYLKEKNSRSDYSQDKTTLLAVWCSNGWTDATLSYSKIRLHAFLTKLSDIRARIAELEAQKDINVTLSAGSIENKGFDGSEKPVFKVGDRVVPESEATNLVRAVREVLEVDGDQIRYHMEAQVRSYWSKAKGWRHATPAEIAAGHRIDEPSSSCGMTTTQLDPNKCGKVDPGLAYDSPGDCPKDDFDAMSEKHRSPSCKCHEFPFDAELKPDPFQQAKNKQHKEISQGKCGEFMAGYDRGFLTAWNEREDQVQFEMQKNRQLQERINELERRNRAFLEKNVDLERSCKMQHAEWSHMKQLLDKTLKGEQGE